MDDQIEACLSKCDLLSFPACSTIFSFSLLAVLPKYISEHVFSGYLTDYIRLCLCFELTFLLSYTCCAAWFSGNTLLT